MLSAEEKFVSCVLLARVWTASAEASTASEDTIRSARAVLCAALTNAAVCRSARLVKAPKGEIAVRAFCSGDRESNTAAALRTALPPGAVLCELSALGLVDVAIAVLDQGRGPVSQKSFGALVLDMKRNLLLERTGRSVRKTNEY